MRFTLNNNGTYSGSYSGTVFHYGDEIPGYVSSTYTPKVWYDKSRSTTNGTWNIFGEMGIAESLILGEAEDDLWNYEEILDEICKFFNLHIAMVGYDYYIFDWETAKSDNSVEWVNLLKPTETQQKSYSEIVVAPENYADDSTQISMGDCYNQIMLTDKIEKYEDVILSPFDSSNLYNIANKQHYMTELAATGEGRAARDAFINLVKGGEGQANYNNNDSSSKREWWFNVKGSKFWKFTLNGQDNYDQIPVDANGNKYKQWMLAKYVEQTPWASGVFSFGHGDKITSTNAQNIENITSFTDYIVINIAGSGEDENSPETYIIYDDYHMPIGSRPRNIYPSDNDIQNSGLKIEYVNSNDGVYSSADSSIMNYLVFSGKIHMTTAHERTGSQGFAGYTQDAYNHWTRETNNGSTEFHYVDDTVFKRKNNTFQDVRNRVYNNYDISGRCVGSDDNPDGRYYTTIFYEQNYPEYSDAPNWSENLLAPPCAEGIELSGRFKYELTGRRSYAGGAAGYDSIPYVDVLAATCQIGNSYCVESIVNGHKHFEWMTEDSLKQQNRYLTLNDGSVIYDAFIFLAIDINDGDYLIGQSHSIYNNITTDMNIEKEGMAIPLSSDAHLSGELRFSIIGPVNITWDSGVRKHATWFRHSSWTNNSISILPHVDKIYLEKFDVAFVSDNGKILINDDNDIIYMSDETQKYVNRKEIEFKFNSALTKNEAAAMGVNPVLGKSTVVNINTGDAVLSVVNNVTSETEKPEKHYVDAYYREFCEPRLIVETALKDSNSFDRFNKYQFPYFEGKKFFVVKAERDLKNESIALTLKEKNS